VKRIIQKNPAPKEKKIYNLENYQNGIENATVRKLLLSVSKMYSSIKIERLRQMFFDDWDQRRIETLVIEMVEEKFLWCRMSHQEGMWYFRAPDRLERNFFMQTYLSNLGHQMNTLYNKELARKDHTSIRKALFDNVREGVKKDDTCLVSRNVLITGLLKNSEEMQKIMKQQAKRERNLAKMKDQERIRTDTERLQKLKRKQRLEQEQKEQEIRRGQEARALAQRQIKKVKEAVGEDVLKRVEQSKLNLLFNQKAEKGEQEILDSKAVESLMVEHLQNIKESQEQKRIEELKSYDYFVRACRKEEVPLLHRKYREEAEDRQEEIERDFLNEVNRKREEHEKRIALKTLSLKLQRHTDWFVHRFNMRREEQYKQAKRIQDEQHEEHLKKQERQKRHNAEKRQQQQQEYKEKIQKSMQLSQSSAPPAQAPEPPSPARRDPPVRLPASSPVAAAAAPSPRRPLRPDPSAAPARPAPVRPPPVRQDPPAREERPLRRTTMPAPIQSGTESSNWRRGDAAPPRQSQASGPRRRFYNSSKASQDNGSTEAGSARPTSVRPAPEKPAPLRPSRGVRPQAPTNSMAGSLRPQGPRRTNPSIRPQGGSAPSVRPSIRPGGLRPQAPSVRPQPPSVRPQQSRVAGGMRSERQMTRSSLRPMAGERGSVRNTNSLRPQAPPGTSWRDRQAAREQGQDLRRPDGLRNMRNTRREEPRIMSNQRRRFFNSKGNSQS